MPWIWSTLRLAIRIATADQLNQDLKTAMASRTVIDTACGMIMAQNRCGNDEAFRLLTAASNRRNQKLDTVATDIIANLSGGPQAPFRFQD